MESFSNLDSPYQPLPLLLKLAATLFYLANCLIYVEVRLLVSRGYSLRMLVDLLGQGGSTTVEALKSNYGEGLGVEGLLDRRLNDLCRLGLVQLEGDQVGPLTPLGKIFSVVTSSMRRLLRFEGVG